MSSASSPAGSLPSQSAKDLQLGSRRAFTGESGRALPPPPPLDQAASAFTGTEASQSQQAQRPARRLKQATIAFQLVNKLESRQRAVRQSILGYLWLEALLERARATRGMFEADVEPSKPDVREAIDDLVGKYEERPVDLRTGALLQSDALARLGDVDGHVRGTSDLADSPERWLSHDGSHPTTSRWVEFRIALGSELTQLITAVVRAKAILRKEGETALGQLQSTVEEVFSKYDAEDEEELPSYLAEGFAAASREAYGTKDVTDALRRRPGPDRP